MRIETTNFTSPHPATTSSNLFTQTVEALEQISHYSCPQHIPLSEEEFLKDIGIVGDGDVEIKTSLDILDFSSTGEHPLLITIFDKVTKERSVKVLRLIVFPSKKTYAVLKNVYWRPYGFVIEGMLSYTHLSFFNEETVYTMEITPIDIPRENSTSYIGGEIKLSQQKGFHSVLENEMLEQLDIGEYRLQIKSFEMKNKISHLSKIIDKKNQGLFSTKITEPLTNQLETRILKRKIVQFFTTNMGEVHLNVKHIGPKIRKK